MANPQIDKIADKILGGLPLSKNDIAYLVDRLILNPPSSESSGGWTTSGTTTLTGTATVLGNSLYGVEFGDGIDDLTHFTVITTGAVTLSWNGGNVVASSGAGIEYGGDYSAGFVSRSLIDRGYADGSYWKTTGTTLLTDVAEVRMENQPNRSISLTANNPTRGHIKIGTGLTTGGNTFIDLTANIGSTGGKILLDNQNIVGEGAGLWVTDGLGVGLQYVSDYSAGFTDRSLADWGNVWKTKGTTTITEDAAVIGDFGGTTRSIYLGSNTIGPTTAAAYAGVQGDGGVTPSADKAFLSYYPDETTVDAIQFSLGLDGAFFEDFRTTTKGIQYAADYSADFVDRSLVDKGYVTSKVTNGTYTPTLTNGTNVAASSVPNPIRYTKIGNVVTVTGIILLDITTASSPASLQISLPIAKDFPDNAGIDFGIGITLASEVGRIISDPTNDTASLTITSANTSNQVVQLNFTYVV